MRAHPAAPHKHLMRLDIHASPPPKVPPASRDTCKPIPPRPGRPCVPIQQPHTNISCVSTYTQALHVVGFCRPCEHILQPHTNISCVSRYTQALPPKSPLRLAIHASPLIETSRWAPRRRVLAGAPESMHAASTPHELSPPASLTSKLVRMPECRRSENRHYIWISENFPPRKQEWFGNKSHLIE